MGGVTIDFTSYYKGKNCDQCGIWVKLDKKGCVVVYFSTYEDTYELSSILILCHSREKHYNRIMRSYHKCPLPENQRAGLPKNLFVFVGGNRPCPWCGKN